MQYCMRPAAGVMRGGGGGGAGSRRMTIRWTVHQVAAANDWHAAAGY